MVNIIFSKYHIDLYKEKSEKPSLTWFRYKLKKYFFLFTYIKWYLCKKTVKLCHNVWYFDWDRQFVVHYFFFGLALQPYGFDLRFCFENTFMYMAILSTKIKEEEGYCENVKSS